VIANCPSCGTHFRHDAPSVPVRARCGRCDTALELTRFRPYRIVPAAVPSHRPVSLDHPSLAASIARDVPSAAAVQSIPEPSPWDDQDPLPPIPEMAVLGAFESSVPHEIGDDMLAPHAAPRREAWHRDSEGAATFALWVATGAIAGTGASWMAGGTTATGLAAGGALGILAGWAWKRWTSPK
jgi:hypothetical protein